MANTPQSGGMITKNTQKDGVSSPSFNTSFNTKSGGSSVTLNATQQEKLSGTSIGSKLGVPTKQAVQQTTSEQRKETNKRMADLVSRTASNGGTSSQDTDILTRAASGEFGEFAQKLAKDKQTQKNDPLKENTTPEPVEDSLDAKIRTIQEAGKNQVIEIQNKLNALSKSMSGATQNLISSIQQLYGARIQAMEKANDGMLKTKLALGQRGGRERYAPMLNASILTDEEIQGHERVAKLEGEMMAAVASAQQAQADNDYKLFNAEYDRIETAQKNMTDQIMDLHKLAVDEENARIAREKEKREAQKVELETMLDLSERSAPAIAAKLDQFATPEEQSAFISEYAKIQGIDPMVLFGDVETALTAQQKAAMDLERTYNLIQTSIKSANTASYNAATSRQNADLATQKNEKALADEQKKQEMTSTMTSELSAMVGDDGFVSPDDYKEARMLWIQANGGTTEDFNKTFSGFVNPDDYTKVGLKEIY